MKKRRFLPEVPGALAIVLAILAFGLTRLGLAAGTGSGQAIKLTEPKDRFLVHVSTDKPIYRIGEKVYVRAVVLNAFDNAPLLENLTGSVEVLSPKGSPVASVPYLQGRNGSLGWMWEVPEGTAGGDYKIKVSAGGYPVAEREFNIRAYRPPRLRTQIEFLKEGYSPSDEVVATLEVTRTEGGIPAGAEVDIIARVDQTEVHRSTSTVSMEGVVTARFVLPGTIAFGDGTLVFNIKDGGVVEPASKTIPILLSHVDLSAYPEGGDLIADVPNRVYFEAIAPNGRPADITAELKNAAGSVVLTTGSQHEGRGSFEFTPKFGETYTLEVVQPWTVTTKVELPDPTMGVSLRADQQVVAAGEPLHLTLMSPLARPVRVVINKRDRELAAMSFPRAFQNGERLAVSVPLKDDAEGVLRVTVFDSSADKPLAERLVFRRPKHELKIELDLDRDAYIPGDKARIIVRASRNGQPVQAYVGLTVTDDGTLEMIEDRRKAPRLPVQVFVEPEVRELADASIYLSDDENAPEALDLLLGTQGWRRFAHMSLDEFVEKHGDNAKRVIAVYDPQVHIVPSRFAGVGGEPQAWFAMDGAQVRMRGAPVQRLGLEKGVLVAPVPVANNAARELPEFDGDDDGFLGERNGNIVGNFALEADRNVPDDQAELPGPAAAEVELVLPEKQEEQARDQDFAGRFVALEAMMANDILRAQSLAPIVVREYAHKARPDRSPDDRVDFTETIYWNAGLATDENGHASVEFDLSDSVTTFRVLADAWTKDGTLGSADAEMESRRPFHVEVKSPLAVTAGDTVDLVATIVNETDDTIDAALVCSTESGLEIGEHEGVVRVPPHSRVRTLVPAKATATTGLQQIIVTASGGGMTDHVTRTLNVAPFGFPVAIHEGGMLEGEAVHTVDVPESVVPGSMTATVAVYPTPLANMTEALEALIRDPHGCFEQTSSTNYPLVMAMQYFSTHEGVDPALIRKTKEKLEKGYERLISYECEDNGYEWFGASPPHEALTAYGLLEFNDMADIYPVDPEMMKRTRTWLLDRRDGKGGFERNSKALDSFGRAPEDITNAYIVWALCTTGERELARELDAALREARTSGDPYLIALTAGALHHAERGADAAPLLRKLASLQTVEGTLKGTTTSITGSGGQALELEAASLAVLAWLNDKAYAANVEKAMKWISEQCKGGRFGSTQSTILALKAIVEYDKSRATPKADGEVILTVNGIEAGSVDFTSETKGALEIAGFGERLTPGSHEVKLRMRDGSPMPYALTIDFHAEQPVSSPECVLDLETVVVDGVVNEGEATEVLVRVRNTSTEGQGMAVVAVGLPGGLEPRHEQLQESVEEGVFDFYEIIGRDVVLYWRDMAPEEQHDVTISVIAATPGEYKGPASRTWLYYTDEYRKWTDPLEVTVKAAE